MTQTTQTQLDASEKRESVLRTVDVNQMSPSSIIESMHDDIDRINGSSVPTPQIEHSE